jgi:hypothetical protein
VVQYLSLLTPKEDTLWQVARDHGGASALTCLQDFKDEDLEDTDNTNIVFTDATPHQIQGTGKMVYWRNCSKVILKQGTVRVRDIVRRTGKGKLEAGLTLYFFGQGGEVNEG